METGKKEKMAQRQSSSRKTGKTEDFFFLLFLLFLLDH
jgi:hypothetical protein